MASLIVALYIVGTRRTKGLEAFGGWASWASEKFCVSVTELDRNISELLTEMANRLWEL